MFIHMKTRLFLFLLLLRASWVQARQELPAYSLDRLVSEALSHNHSVQAKRMAEVKAAASYKETRAGQLPQLQAVTNYTYYPNLPVSLLPAEAVGAPFPGYLPAKLNTQYQSLVGLDASWAVFNQGMRTGTAIAKEGIALAVLDTRKEQENLVEQIHYLYYGLYVLDRQLEITQANLTNINQLIASSRIALEAGLIKQTELDKVAVNQANLTSAIRNLTTAKNQQLNTLKFFCAMSDTVALVLENPVFSLDEWQQEPEGQQTDMRIMTQRIRMAELERKAAMAGYFPVIQATAGANELIYGTSFRQSFGGEYSYGFQSIGLRLQWNLFDGLQKRHKLAKNRANMSQLKAQEALVISDVRLRQRNAIEKIEASLAGIRSQEANMVLARKVLEDTRLSNQAGLATITDVLLADNALKQSQNEYLVALSNYFVALVEWRKAKGTLLPAQ